MYKKLFALSLTLALWSLQAQAFTVSLQATNTTNAEVQTQGSLSYEQNGTMIWQAPMPTINTIIAQEGKNIPLDETRQNLTSYDLEYLDFKDMNNKVLASCLDDYYPIRENAILRFTLYKVPGNNNKYKCVRQVIKETDH